MHYSSYISPNTSSYYHSNNSNLYNLSEQYLYQQKKYHQNPYDSLIRQQKRKQKEKIINRLSNSNKNMRDENINTNMYDSFNTYDYWTKAREQQRGYNGFGGSSMSHKRYLSMMEQDTNKQHIHNNSFYNTASFKSKPTNKDTNFATNLSLKNIQKVPYPYSYKQYELLKQKMQEKRYAEDKWLQREISRMKKEDELHETFLGNKRKTDQKDRANIKFVAKQEKNLKNLKSKAQNSQKQFLSASKTYLQNHEKKIKQKIPQKSLAIDQENKNMQTTLKVSKNKDISIYYHQNIQNPKRGNQKKQKPFMNASINNSEKKQQPGISNSNKNLIQMNNNKNFIIPQITKKPSNKPQQKPFQLLYQSSISPPANQYMTKSQIYHNFLSDRNKYLKKKTDFMKQLNYYNYELLHNGDLIDQELKLSKQIKLKTDYNTKYSYLTEKQRKIIKAIDQASKGNKGNNKVGQNGKKNCQLAKEYKNFKNNFTTLNELKQCHSDFQQQQQQRALYLQKKVQTHNNSKQLKLKKLKTQSPLVLLQKFQKTPQKINKNNQFMFDQPFEQTDKIKNLSDIKHDRRYIDILATIQRRQLKKHRTNYKTSKSNPHKHFFINKTQHKQHNSSLLLQQKPIKSLIKQKILSNKSDIEQMEFYERNQQQHLPIFSPYKEHKHLPQHKSHYLISSSVDNKKSNKHYLAIEQRKEMENKINRDFHQLIVDEVEKRKILLKKHLDTTNFKNQMYIHEHQHHQRVFLQPSGMSHGTQQHLNQQKHSHLSNPPTFPIGQQIGKNIKIQLQILKQQLEQKNKKVVDLQLQLMELKNTHSHIENLNNSTKLLQKQFSTAQHIQQQNPVKNVLNLNDQKPHYRRTQSHKLTIDHYRSQTSQHQQNNSYQDNQCQTSFFDQRTNKTQIPRNMIDSYTQTQQHYKPNHLLLSRFNIQQIILPDPKKQSQRISQKKQSQQLIKKLQNKLNIQQEAISNFFEDLQVYQKQNDQLRQRIKRLEQEKKRLYVDKK